MRSVMLAGWFAAVVVHVSLCEMLLGSAQQAGGQELRAHRQLKSGNMATHSMTLDRVDS